MRNEGEYGVADSFAKAAAKLLSPIGKGTDEVEVERSYWEAVLLGEFLGRNEEALSLVQKARVLAPNDDRLLELELSYLQARANNRK